MSKLINRKRKVLLIKFLASLSLIRWYNLISIVIAQYLTALFVFNPDHSKKEVLLNWDLHFMVLATAFIVAAGFIINAFYDLEKDLVLNPHKTVFNRLISKTSSFKAYFAFNLIGLIFSALTSWRVFLYFLLFSAALWYYSHKLQKKAIIREISASLLIVASVLSVGLYYHHIDWPIAVYSLLVIVEIFNLQLNKELLSYEADLAVGNETIPVKFGFDFAHKLQVYAFYGIAIMALLMFYKTNSIDLKVFLAFLAGSMVVSRILISKKELKYYKWSNLLVKVLLFLSIIFIVFV